MTWVKVCGLTRPVDVAAAVDAGADALGFVLADGSPRQISVEIAASLMEGVPAVRVLVTVDARVAAVAEAVAATGANGVQPHGAESGAVARWAQQAGLFVLRPVAASEGEALQVATIPEGQIPLLDSARGPHHGGTGVTLDWGTLKQPDRPFVLAGGLDPTNVAEAIGAVHPWGVDASSGLESSPGIKDPARVVAFVEVAKQT